jgi:hypothetical protein
MKDHHSQAVPFLSQFTFWHIPQNKWHMAKNTTVTFGSYLPRKYIKNKSLYGNGELE